MVFDLSHNRLTGSLPEELGQLGVWSWEQMVYPVSLGCVWGLAGVHGCMQECWDGPCHSPVWVPAFEVGPIPHNILIHATYTHAHTHTLSVHPTGKARMRACSTSLITALTATGSLAL